MDMIFAEMGQSDQAPRIDPSACAQTVVRILLNCRARDSRRPLWGKRMKRIAGLILVMSLAACSVCKSSDSPEVCRTKERDHSQPHADIAVVRFTAFQATLVSAGLVN
jgi:hypothetical protein